MADQRHGVKYASATLNPKGQNLEMIHRIVGLMLEHGGCLGCGRAAILRVDFLSDPPPDLAKENVVSFETQGL